MIYGPKSDTYIVESTPAGRRSPLARRKERLLRSFVSTVSARACDFLEIVPKILYVISCNHRRPILCHPRTVFSFRQSGLLLRLVSSVP